MRILICGSRDWKNKSTIRKELRLVPKGTVIIQGECRGADQIAKGLALNLGLEVECYPANWKGLGKAAGIIRNREMLVEGKPTEVWAFHPDLSKSKGTAHMVKIAKMANVSVRLFDK